TSLTLSWPPRGASEPSESSPEPPSPSSSRPPASSPSPSPSLEATPSLPDHAHEGRGQTGLGSRASERPQQSQPNGNLELKMVSIVRRGLMSRGGVLECRAHATTALPPQVGSLGTLRGVALPTLQAPLALVLVLRLPWVVGAGGLLQAGAIAVIMATCVSGAAVCRAGPGM
ncbi:S12A7 protein, partial [Geococcyx californianus]|nr:S12A7 protein [Geococcyx californianus]